MCYCMCFVLQPVATKLMTQFTHMYSTRIPIVRRNKMTIKTLPLTIISERQHPGQYKQEHTKSKLGSKEYLFIAIQHNQHLPAALQI